MAKPSVTRIDETTAWHNLPTSLVLQKLLTESKQGLSALEAQQRLVFYGQNVLTHAKSTGAIRLFLAQLQQPLVYILLFAGGVTAFLREWVDASVILGVVLLNALIGFIQEAHALKAIAALSSALNIQATVQRDGDKMLLPASSLVPGDIVLLQAGDKVPADLRLLVTRELQIDESALTGESVPVLKQTTVLVATNTVLAERTNMAYSSTLVTHGMAEGVVVATGDNSEIGRIQHLLATTTALETPLTLKLAQLSTWLLWSIMGCAVLTFYVGWQRGESALDMFMAAVALAVGAIPEGLPAALTITLSIGVARMARRNAIVRKLPAVETLGSTTVICSDKTGTLTQNQMTVQTIIAGGEVITVSDNATPFTASFKRETQEIAPQAYPALIQCLQAGLLCNDARLLRTEQGWHTEGDPTEIALLLVAHKAGLKAEQLNDYHPRIDTLPFAAQHQLMATLHHNQALATHQLYVKGSVESIVLGCINMFDAQLTIQPLDAEHIHRQASALAQQGLRVLAFACCHQNSPIAALTTEHLPQNLTFIGLQAMMDPPRPEVCTAIAACQAAGIRVKMITGDHPLTAQSIAIQLGLIPQKRLLRLCKLPAQPLIITGNELLTMSDTDLAQCVQRCDVYARINPEQKLRLVQILQAQGEIVAMTGDGVNDAPALYQANIGVAMGKGGTEVAKESAAMVLTDDNFATIVAAIEEGRCVFDNIVKFIAWTLPTNLGEGLVIVVAVMLGIALPITPVQILWINMSTAVLLGLMLAFETKEPGLMQHKPRLPTQPLLTPRLLFRIVLVGCLLLIGAFGLFAFELAQGESLTVARTAAVNLFVFSELFYLLAVRSLNYPLWQIGIWSNPWLSLGVASMTLAQLLFTYWPPMQRLFASSALSYSEWCWILLFSALVYLVIEAEKWWVRYHKRQPLRTL